MRACTKDDPDNLCDDPEITRPRRNDASAIANVLLQGEPLTRESTESFDDGPTDPGMRHDNDFVGVVSQGSRLTLGSKLLSRLSLKKRERFLCSQLGHDDLVLPGVTWRPPEKVELEDEFEDDDLDPDVN